MAPVLRGFDSYELKLGDELRGERASKGKTLLDVQRDLRIRAEYIDAIENADASAFPFSGFAAGYVRSYARYLDLDADDIYRRFCDESGFQGAESGASVEPNFSGAGDKASATATPLVGAIGAPSQIQTKFLPSATDDRRMEIGASLRGLASIGVLCALVVGIGYGGWTVLQNIQRVGFAPLPTAPAVQVSAPDFLSPTQVAAAESPATNADDAPRATLAALYAFQETPLATVEPRDGPIASINPATAGIYAPPDVGAAPEIDLTETPTPLGGVDASIIRAMQDEERRAEEAAQLAANGVSVFAKEEAWVRVRDGDDDILFTGILAPGERFTLPADAADAQLRAGNAGAVYIVLGSQPFGPLGDGPEVAKGVALAPEAVRAAYPLAANVAVNDAVVDEEPETLGRRADAVSSDVSAIALSD
ncbi:MAG: RodZ domain-containing protein [Pseudomonadota bacterium]